MSCCFMLIVRVRAVSRRLGFFFFSSRRRHTRWTGDWSSDVCSSDLENVEREKQLAVGSQPDRFESSVTGRFSIELIEQSGDSLALGCKDNRFVTLLIGVDRAKHLVRRILVGRRRMNLIFAVVLR